MNIPNPLTSLSAEWKWLLTIGAILILAFGSWALLSGGWNKIGSLVFDHQIKAERIKLQKELDQASKDKEALKQTLFELKQAKEDLAKAKEAREAAERIFYDQSKTSAQKVAEYKETLSSVPTHTPTDNITIDDLCARAKAANSGPELIAALCGN